MSRSLSLPVINKEKSIQKMNSFFRVIPSTPRVKDEDSEVSMATPGNDGNYKFSLIESGFSNLGTKSL